MPVPGKLTALKVAREKRPGLYGDVGGLYLQVTACGSKGAGWVDYMFPKPGQTQASHNWSYVKGFRTDGMSGLIGAGFFQD
jgi:hypothetical protein